MRRPRSALSDMKRGRLGEDVGGAHAAQVGNQSPQRCDSHVLRDRYRPPGRRTRRASRSGGDSADASIRGMDVGRGGASNRVGGPHRARSCGSVSPPDIAPMSKPSPRMRMADQPQRERQVVDGVERADGERPVVSIGSGCHRSSMICSPPAAPANSVRGRERRSARATAPSRRRPFGIGQPISRARSNRRRDQLDPFEACRRKRARRGTARAPMRAARSRRIARSSMSNRFGALQRACALPQA